jgi:hypothetical protein
MKSTTFGFAAAGSIMTILFLAFINFTTSGGYLWFVYPAFAMLWWPLSVFFAAKGKYKSFSLAGSLLILAFLFSINFMFSPAVPWLLFAALPVLWWPAITFLGKRAASMGFAITSFCVALIYYGALNLFMFPAHPWIIYVAYGMIWWPVSQFFLRRKQQFAYSVLGTIFTIVFFMAVNFITTPHNPWFIYPAFAVLWWPLTIYFFVYKKKSA